MVLKQASQEVKKQVKGKMKRSISEACAKARIAEECEMCSLHSLSLWVLTRRKVGVDEEVGVRKRWRNERKSWRRSASG